MNGEQNIVILVELNNAENTYSGKIWPEYFSFVERSPLQLLFTFVTA